MAKPTKKQLITRKHTISHSIMGIKFDYAGVDPEDMPPEITEELATLMTEMKQLRVELGNE